jgi:DNA-binding MarR family transcriptional regulator
MRMADGRARPDEVEAMLALWNELMERVQSLESAPRDFDTGLELHRAETHTLQAVGLDEGTNLVRLARRLGVTKGAVSQMIAKLEGKGLVVKRPADDDGRAFVLGLTPLGWRAFRAHERFHAEMHAAVRDHLGARSKARLARIRAALRDLVGIVEAYARRTEGGKP